jgi:hypothetical protein
MSSLRQKLEKRPKQVLPGREGGWKGEGGEGAGGRNDPNNVCTYEYMSKE